jgi:hypothetical protein
MKHLLIFLTVTVFFFSCRKQTTDPQTLPDLYSDQAIGKSANDLLSDKKYTKLNIQIQYMGGFMLEQSTLDSITHFLDNRCNKPGGITIEQRAIDASGDTLTLSEIAVLEKKYRTAYTSGNTLSLYVMVTNGYDTSENILGFAFRNTSICLFGRNISDHSGLSGGVSKVSLQTTVLEHELGHLLGLVNLGSPMQQPHQDTANGNHCNNPKCLLYWSIETHKGYFSVSNAIPVLDSNCLHDLRANGGK